MSKEENFASANAGSAQNVGPSNEGEPKSSSVDAGNDQFVPKSQYEELEKKIGAQGQELGEYREFMRGIEPLLDKLQGNDDLIQAIVDGHVTSELAQAVVEGKVKIEDATQVAQAHEEVKKDLGIKKYNQSSPEDIEKLISEKIRSEIDSFKKNIKGDIDDLEDRRKFEDSIQKFITNTSDFPEYAEDVTKWLDDHPEIYDIETAYYAVKGRKAAAVSKEEYERSSLEEAKRIASNAAGGGSMSTTYVEDKDMVSSLIAKSSNPNTL